jgi:hypothetical protein
MPRVTEVKPWKNIGSVQESRTGLAEGSAVFAGAGCGGTPGTNYEGTVICLMKSRGSVRPGASNLPLSAMYQLTTEKDPLGEDGPAGARSTVHSLSS